MDNHGPLISDEVNCKTCGGMAALLEFDFDEDCGREDCPIKQIERPVLVITEADQQRLGQCVTCGGSGYIQRIPGETEDCPTCNAPPPPETE